MKKISILFILALSFVTAKGQIITTIAGNGTFGDSGDGGPAINAKLASANDVCLYAGNIYICTNSRIRKIDAAGIITTVAGDGTSSTSGGDNGPATAAQLYSPNALTFDGVGNMYIAEFSKVRKVNPSGIITTVAGNGVHGNSGDGGPATDAALKANGIAVDAAGNIYISDVDNNIVRKVGTDGIIMRFAGSGFGAGTGTGNLSGDGGPATVADMFAPIGLAVDNAGNVYIADQENYRIRKVDAAGIISTFAGTTGGYAGDGGPATAAKFYSIVNVAVDVNSNVYAVDDGYGVVRKINTSGIITTVAGNGTQGYSGDNGLAVLAQLYGPEGVAVDDTGTFYIADHSNNRLRKVTAHPVAIKTVNGVHALPELYPNPTHEELTIKAVNKITDVRITDMIGREVYSSSCNDAEVKVNIKDLPVGLYFVRVNNGSVQRFVKE